MADKCTRCGFNQLVSSRVNKDCEACFFTEAETVMEWTMEEWEHECGQNEAPQYHAFFNPAVTLIIEEEV